MNRLVTRVTPPGDLNTGAVLAIFIDFMVLCVSRVIFYTHRMRNIV